MFTPPSEFLKSTAFARSSQAASIQVGEKHLKRGRALVRACPVSSAHPNPTNRISQGSRSLPQVLPTQAKRLLACSGASHHQIVDSKSRSAFVHLYRHKQVGLEHREGLPKIHRIPLSQGYSCPRNRLRDHSP